MIRMIQFPGVFLPFLRSLIPPDLKAFRDEIYHSKYLVMVVSI